MREGGQAETQRIQEQLDSFQLFETIRHFSSGILSRFRWRMHNANGPSLSPATHSSFTKCSIYELQIVLNGVLGSHN
jgi:hypothetical protein